VAETFFNRKELFSFKSLRSAALGNPHPNNLATQTRKVCLFERQPPHIRNPQVVCFLLACFRRAVFALASSVCPTDRRMGAGVVNTESRVTPA
ncbi:hypothetical protein AVEN_100146-1, partial [Araneus ventricosus]